MIDGATERQGLAIGQAGDTVKGTSCGFVARAWLHDVIADGGGVRVSEDMIVAEDTTRAGNVDEAPERARSYFVVAD